MANARQNAMMQQRRSNQKASLNKRLRKKEEKKRKLEKKKVETETDSSDEDTRPNRGNESRRENALDQTGQQLLTPSKNKVNANESANDSIEAELARLN